MAALWQKLTFEFCKVSVVCWNGEPNWLGWIILVFAALIVLGVIVGILSALAN